jgi:hypothetical protein
VTGGLDSWRFARLNLRVRAILRLAVVTLVVASAATAWARPRVQVTPFAVREEALGYFGPEVARAVAAALEGAGVETGSGAEAIVTGRIEPLAGDRVRLAATLRGRTLTAEGPLEAMDAVATQLANQIAPLLLENDPAGQRAAEKRARDAARRAAAVPPSPQPGSSRVVAAPPPSPPRVVPAAAPAVAASKASDSAPQARPEAKPEAKSEAKAEAKPEAKAETKPDAKLDAKVEARPEAKTLASAEAASRPAESGKPDAPKAAEATRSEIKEPDWSPPRVDAPPPPAAPRPTSPVAAPPPYFGGYVRGRVVAHAVADAQSAYPGSGSMATQALFSFLQRRLRLSVIPTGVGITNAAVAADEGYRAGARAVVMLRLENVQYLPGPMVRCRLEVVVIRDGRPVMRRAVEATPADNTRRTGDPLYSAVTAGLEALVPELVGALADVR